MTITTERAIGGNLARIEGPDKVTGAATYAFEYAHDNVAYLWLVQATVAKGRIRSVRTADAVAEPGVLAVLTTRTRRGSRRLMTRNWPFYNPIASPTTARSWRSSQPSRSRRPGRRRDL